MIDSNYNAVFWNQTVSMLRTQWPAIQDLQYLPGYQISDSVSALWQAVQSTQYPLWTSLLNRDGGGDLTQAKTKPTSILLQPVWIPVDSSSTVTSTDNNRDNEPSPLRILHGMWQVTLSWAQMWKDGPLRTTRSRMPHGSSIFCDFAQFVS